MELKFKKGDFVKHKIGSEVMIFDHYEEKAPSKTYREVFGGHKTIETGPKMFTGKAWCVRLINNIEKGEYFDVDNLIFCTQDS